MKRSIIPSFSSFSMRLLTVASLAFTSFAICTTGFRASVCSALIILISNTSMMDNFSAVLIGLITFTLLFLLKEWLSY